MRILTRDVDRGALPSVVSAAILADLVGISSRRVNQLAQVGPMVRRGDGFDLAESLRNYCASLRRDAHGRSVNSAPSTDKERLVAAQADLAEAKAAEKRGELVPAAQVERAWASILRDLRARMLAVPSRVGSRLPSLTAHDIATIGREIADALTETAQEGADHA